MPKRVAIDGLRELDQALGQLGQAAAKGTLRKVLKEAGEPVARAARQRAPKSEGHLIESIDVSTRLSRSQSAAHREAGGRAFQEMFVGTNNPAGMQQEFGNERHPAQPFMRPAWDAQKGNALEIIANSLWGEIEKTAKRLARKAQRATKA